MSEGERERVREREREREKGIEANRDVGERELVWERE